MDKQVTWRAERGMVCKTVYRRKFAFFPVTCSDSRKVWLKNYYSRYDCWSNYHYDDEYNGYTDFIEFITEEEFMVRKIKEGF